MKIVIAEKPRMAQAIANALNVKKGKERGVYQNDEFCIVSCQGHILTEYEPHDYSEELRQWSLVSLPIIPENWKVKPNPGKERFLLTIKNVLSKGSIVYAAGDPDSAGQRIVDEVLKYFNWKGETLRPLINDLNSAPIKKAIDNAAPNSLSKFQGLYRKEVCRARGDWLLGMNLTRLYTLLGKQSGLNVLLSAGRVQSATLGLVAKRDLEILNFKPHDYYSVKAGVRSKQGTFKATWCPSEYQDGVDSEGRLVSPGVAQELLRMAPIVGTILDFQEAQGVERAPLPYSMSALQKHASKKYGMTMKEVLDIAQSLYDKHELITYPRSDTGYLPESQHADAPVIVSTILNNMPDLVRLANSVNLDNVSKAFNDKKLTAHHAIIPTQRCVRDASNSLTEAEFKIYDMVCRQYLIQFMADAIVSHRKVSVLSENGEVFKAFSKVYTYQGWKSEHFDEDHDESEDQKSELPALVKGESVDIVSVDAYEKTTKPPAHFTDATLLDAMTNIHRHVEDPEVAKHLRDGEGIGTEATRADIIEKLVGHGLCVREGKPIKATDEGFFHYKLMPQDLTSPDMAGLFEYSLRKIESGDLEQSEFLDFISNFIIQQIDSSDEWVLRAKESGVTAKGPKCRNCESTLKSGRSRKSKAKLWVCNVCNSIYMNDAGMPGICVKGNLRESDQEAKVARQLERKKNAPPCPNCQEPILREKSKSKKFYWQCLACDSLYSDFGGAIGAPFKLNGESCESPADGPACTQCDDPMHRRMTKSSKPIFICKKCDSMAWSNDGLLGTFFKIKGEMVKR